MAGSQPLQPQSHHTPLVHDHGHDSEHYHTTPHIHDHDHDHCDGLDLPSQSPTSPTDTTTTFSEANRDHYNSTATHYETRPDAQRLAHKLANAMLRTGLFVEGKTEVMDFACGPGLISQALAAHTKSIIGVDISQAMVERYNLAVDNHGIPRDEMRAVCVAELRVSDEERGERDEDELAGSRFDVVVCASSYHHFSSIDTITKTLASYLKPGGSLLVGDILKDTSSSTSSSIFPENVHHIVAHRGGLSEADIRGAFEGAGLCNFVFQKVGEARRAGHPVTFFLARGDKL